MILNKIQKVITYLLTSHLYTFRLSPSMEFGEGQRPIRWGNESHLLAGKMCWTVQTFLCSLYKPTWLPLVGIICNLGIYDKMSTYSKRIFCKIIFYFKWLLTYIDDFNFLFSKFMSKIDSLTHFHKWAPPKRLQALEAFLSKLWLQKKFFARWNEKTPLPKDKGLWLWPFPTFKIFWIL